ncbi:MAG: radical SAM protein [Candidatus Kryptonium sp.]|nr:radical SAM protein [Candidatus Kryptonium sp.]
MEKIGENVVKTYIRDVGDVYFNLQKYSTTISEEHKFIYYFDAEGRFMGGFFDGISYRRGLDNRLMKKFFDKDGFKVKVFADKVEKRKVIEDVIQRVNKIRSGLSECERMDEILERIDGILRWNFDELEKDGVRFLTVYKPISILPPDQYFSLVIQIAEGCSWNRCTFCSFYQDRKFRVKSPDELVGHIVKIKEFFGKSIGLRKSIFLGDANALVIPQKRLVELIKIVHDEFPIGQFKKEHGYVFDGIYSFLDIFGAERKSYDEYIELKELLVKRIYIGLETGDETLFKYLNKPGSPSECIDVVSTIKKAGINVGIIILAGAGGKKFYNQHVKNTVETIVKMPIGNGDIIYLSPLVLDEADEYVKIMAEIGSEMLNKFEISSQIQEIKEGLKGLNKIGVRVTLYDIQEFIY